LKTMSVRLENTPLMPIKAKVDDDFVWGNSEQDPIYHGYFDAKSSCCCLPCHDAFDLRRFAKAIKDNLCPICHKPFKYIMQTRTTQTDKREMLWPLLPHSTHNTPRSYNSVQSAASTHSHSSYNSTPQLTAPGSYNSGRSAAPSVYGSAYSQPQTSHSHGSYNSMPMLTQSALSAQSAHSVPMFQQPAPNAQTRTAPRLLQEDPNRRRKMIPIEIPVKQSIFTRQQHTKQPEYIYT
jgi:hypothetical protein